MWQVLRRGKCVQGFGRETWGNETTSKTGVDRWIILKWVFKKQGGRTCTGLIWFRMETSAGLLWTRWWTCGSLKMWEPNDWLMNSCFTIRTQLYGPCNWQLCINLLKPTGYVMHQQFNIQQLCVLPTLYLCVLYLSENKQRLVPLTA